MEWHHYLQREPTDGERLEYMLAVVAHSVFGASGKVKRMPKVTDFLPKWGPAKRQTVTDMVNRFKLAGRMADEIARKKAQKPKGKKT